MTSQPSLEEIIAAMGDAGKRLCDIDACEGAAGNISVYMGWSIDPRGVFPNEETISLPQAVPEMAGHTFVVTGSGRRLREIKDDPGANLGCLVINKDGKTGQLFTSPRRLFARLTSEFNSHLAVHYQQKKLEGTPMNAVVHAQPRHLTYFTHIPSYRDEKYLNYRLLRWQPEAIVFLPEGIGVVPFFVPGSPDLMAANVAALKTHHVVVWCKHGAMARSEHSVKAAVDKLDYAETIANYEYMNLLAGEKADALSVDEILSICKLWDVKQSVF
ncbi:MAG TPA: class II aldolase/adducin family protein [Thermoflexales bacterium]|nr:class II aldolase/adducin family protein [Thermoflexales bacterium]